MLEKEMVSWVSLCLQPKAWMNFVDQHREEPSEKEKFWNKVWGHINGKVSITNQVFNYLYSLISLMKVLIFFLINEIKWTIAIINVTLAKNGIWNGMKSEPIFCEKHLHLHYMTPMKFCRALITEAKFNWVVFVRDFFDIRQYSCF